MSGRLINCNCGKMQSPILVCLILVFSSVAFGLPAFKSLEIEFQDILAVCVPGQNYIPAEDCTRYWNCTTGDAIASRCELGLYWNPDIDLCDFPSAVDECVGGTRPPVTPPTPVTGNPTTDGSVTGGSLPTSTEDPPISCGSQETGYIPHPDCTKYYICTNYIGIVHRCDIGLLWNPRINLCDFPIEVPECVGGTRPPLDDFAPTINYDLLLEEQKSAGKSLEHVLVAKPGTNSWSFQRILKWFSR